MFYIKNYLKNKQPIIYQTFVNAIKNKKIAHAYLIVGDNFSTLLKKIAVYLVKSLICDNNINGLLACEKCETCKRIENGSYVDVIIYDNEKINEENNNINSIKKDDINYLTTIFSNTTIEKKHISIYIINLVENMSTQTSNALLKFLEEPKSNVYAFLTTKNFFNVLPTIISRCQILKMQLNSINKTIKELIEQKISESDAKLLAHICDTVQEANNIIKSDMYIVVKKCLYEFINHFDKKENLLFLMDNFIITNLINNEYIILFLNLLIAVFENIIHNLNDVKYDKLFNLLHNSKNIELFLFETIKIKNNLNLNIANSLDHLAIFFMKNL